MFRVSGTVQGGVMQERWFPGIWLGKKLHTEEHLVMKEDGLVVRSRAVRENSQDLTMEDFNKLVSTPHDPLGTIRAATRSIRPAAQTQEHEEEFGQKPRRAKITKNIIEKFGPTPGCQKCRALATGDHGYEAVGHSAACRERIEDMMKKDPNFKERIDRADERITRSLADYIEKKDNARKNLEEDGEQAAKKARLEVPSSASGSRDPLVRQAGDGDADMCLPEAKAEAIKRDLEDPRTRSNSHDDNDLHIWRC